MNIDHAACSAFSAADGFLVLIQVVNALRTVKEAGELVYNNG